MDKEEVFFVDKENNYIKWLLIMAIFIGLLALGTYVYYKLTPKNIFESVISKIDFESSDKSSTSEQVKFAKRYDFSYNAYSDNKDIEQLLVILNKYKYRLDLYYNNENEVRFEADLTFNDKKLLNLLFGYNEKMTYVGAYDRTYYFENLDNISEEEQVKYEESKSKFDKFLDELNDENDLNDKFFKPVVDAFKDSVEDYNLKRTVSKDNIVLTITYDNKFYKRFQSNLKKNGFVDLLNRIGFKTDGLVPEKYRIRKTIITLNRNNLEYSLGNVRFYSDVDYFEVNIVDGKTTEYNINTKEDNKNIYKLVIEEVNDNKFKVLLQDNKNGFMVDVVYEEKDIEYKDYDYSKSKNLDNVDEKDLIYLEEQLGNSEGMNELYKQIQIMMFGGSM